MLRLLSILFCCLFLTFKVNSQETCSRIAVVNYQEVIVDTSASSRGEGLRYYLEKDKKSEELLDEYQQKNKPQLWNTISSSVGSGMVLAGLLHSDNSENASSSRNGLIFGGLLISTVSYLVLKTTEYNNEKILKNAVDQYNKRNLPRIYFSPYNDNNRNLGVGVGVSQEF